MSKKELKLEVGKRYVRRDGTVTGPLTHADNRKYPFYCAKFNLTWTVTGEMLPPHTSRADLVAEYSPSAAATDEETVAAFNELVRAGKIQFNEKPDGTGDWIDQDAPQRLKPVIKSITLPDSGYAVEIDGEKVKVGCQSFLVSIVCSILKYLLEGGGLYDSAKFGIFTAARAGIKHRNETLSWNDADVLLKFLSEASFRGNRE